MQIKFAEQGLSTISRGLAQLELRRDEAVVFVCGVALSELLTSLEGCKVHASLGIEPFSVGDAPGLELISACINFYDVLSAAESCFVHLSGALLPFCIGRRHDTRIIKDGQVLSVLGRVGEPQNPDRLDFHPFHLNLLVTALRKNSAAYQRGSDLSSACKLQA